ncbi:MAG: flagellin-like hook-associated protein FlgL [bacterium]|jgi:flagellin-like hook-associated protein FlgL
MRVTDLTKQNAVVRNMNNNSEDFQNLMTNISSGKRINKPSDDPVGAVSSQDYRTTISHIDVTNRNISADKVWLDSTENYVTQMNDILSQTKALGLQAANAPSTGEARGVIARELDSLLQDLIDLGNGKEGKLFLFSGTKTFTKPFEMGSRRNATNAHYTGTRIQSSRKFLPFEQAKPLDAVQAGSFTLNLTDTKGKITPITIDLKGTESIKDIVEKINLSAAGEGFFTESKSSPTGYEAKLFAQIGVDNKLYLDPEKGYKLSFGEKDTTNFTRFSRFGIMGDDGWAESGLPQIRNDIMTSENFDAHFEGHSDNQYTIRIVQGGTFDNAKYVISDDDGKSWSPPEDLKQKIDVYNPKGKANSQVVLKFESELNPFFKEGVEFQFDGNPVVLYKGNNQTKEVLLDNGIRSPVNLTGREIFYKTDDDSINIFDAVYRLKENALSDDSNGLSKSITNIEIALDQVLKKRAKVGVLMRKAEQSESRLEMEKMSKMRAISDLEDLDLPKSIVNLNAAELRHKASLDASARLIQPSLVQFLK